MNPRPHGRKRTRKGSSGMKGYSRYASTGKGLSDVATRAYASSLRPGSSAHKSYTTFSSKLGGLKAIGSFQILGATAATLGYGGEGLRTAPVTHVWGTGAYGTGYYDIGKDGLVFTGTRAQREQEITQRAVVARGMTGEQTTAYSPKPTGFGRAAMGGMGRGEWERPQIKKEEAKTGATGVGTVVAIGGVGYLLWSLLK